jgi:hypothetical protein
MKERTGDEIRMTVANAEWLLRDGVLSFGQYIWVTTYFTLPPSAESLRETRQVA